MRRVIVTMMIIVLGLAGSLMAQQTTGNITGRLVDAQGSAVPGVTVTAKNTQTGLTRTDVSDAEGVYRLTALQVGTYDISAELSGFSKVENKEIVVTIGQTLDINMTLKVANMSETVTVTGETPLIETSSSSVGGVVDIKRIESLPLNGRQFANLAATIPGVGLGFHTDPTKSTQYAPQINGGAGRNVNYQIDGGDNNDDTVGGLLQAYPLEAIQEFNFVTQRFKAEYGRSNGGVMNIVTKSGTNNLSGSFFESFRDKWMNARTETEKIANADKQDYRRNQFGGSLGGPILKDKAHYFAAYERTQQDTTQTVNTKGLLPSLDGSYAVPYRENLFTGKASANLRGDQYLSVRYGYNNNKNPYDAAPNHTFDNWGDSTNEFNSINLNHNWVLPGNRLNEFIFQYADFTNHIASRSSAPNETFVNGVQTGANINTPQTTAQKKYQFRDDFSWHLTGKGGLGHDLKTGVNFINEPRLFITFNTAKGAVINTHLTNDVNGPIQTVTLSDGDSSANVPTKQFGTYIQDDWRPTDRLTVNLGLRWDYVTGYQFDQSQNPNYVAIVNAAKAGLLNGIVGLENFALSPENDKNNYQPRIGAAWDVRGDGKDVVRGGWGVYNDFGYTNSNVLFAAADAMGKGFGTILNVDVAGGIRNPDGSFYRAGQPLSNIQSQNTVTPGAKPLFGQYVDPRLEQPYSKQTNAGWSHELMRSTVVSVDYVNAIGDDLNFRPRVNQLIGGGSALRRIGRLVPTLSPNSAGNRPTVSRGHSEYNALITSVKRRMTNGLDLTASYTLSSAKSTIGDASDALNTANIQDPNNPFDDPRQFAPNLTTDARHRFNATAIWQAPYGITVAPFFLFRSALPVYLIDGRDLNLDGDINDIPTVSYRAVSYNKDTHTMEIKQDGDCKTVNCGRFIAQSQVNLRVSKSFRLGGSMRIEAIADLFNVFNALNPGIGTTSNRRLINPTTGAADATLLQPTSFSGDAQRPEQRVGQLGFRFSF
jgi:hypothetical protein